MAAASATAIGARAAATPQAEWTKQLGTAENDEGLDVSADAGGVFVAGYSAGSLAGPNSGGNTPPGVSTNPDAFIRRYDRAGNLLWGRQVGDVFTDRGLGVAADPSAGGGAYLTGSTGSNLDGTNQGGTDQFLSRLSGTGQLLWTRQIGTGVNDAGLSVSADALGNVFVGGNTFGSLAATNTGINRTDATLSRYDSAGNLKWTLQWGQEDTDNAHAVAADGLGGVFIAGDTRTLQNGNDRGFEATIRRYDGNGTLTWSRTLGTQAAADQAFGVAADGHGGLYVSGRTEGSLGGINPTPLTFDAFIARYDGAGNLLWVRQLASPGQDFGYKVAADGSGHVYITGSVIQALPGEVQAAAGDAFVAQYDEAGNLLWHDQFGSSQSDTGFGVAADGAGNLYVTGSTAGALFGPSGGGPYDAFLVRYSAIPEPATAIAFIIPTAILACGRRRRRHW